MFEADERGETEKMNNQSSGGFTGETDRVNGEYHFKSGYTQKIYSDAHYVPEDESYVPPRYYTPPEKEPKAPKTPREPKEKKPGHGIGAVAACIMCLACAIIGGLCGAAIVEKQFDTKLQAIEERIPAAEEAETETEEELPLEQANAAVVTFSALANTVSASDIYNRACSQVVGITTEVNYTNFFGMTSSSAVTGSGFFVTDDGYILTNYHVIEYAAQYGYDVTVITHDGTRHIAQLVGYEESNDLAVLKVETSDAVAATLGDSDSLYVGDEIYPVGNPLGELEFSMTFGHVSALDRLITTDETDDPINMFQIDAAVNSGNSGGPVYNSVGDVVGIVTAKYKSSGVEGIGFAIPINDALKIANELITNGYVSGKAKLGLSLDHRYTSMYSRYYGLPEGAYVAAVEAGGCAETAGILPGDIIIAIGSNAIRSYADVETAVKHFGAGEATDIIIYRSGEELTLRIVFDEYVPGSASAVAAKGSGKR